MPVIYSAATLRATAQRYLARPLYQSARSRASFTQAGLALKEVRMSFRQFFTWASPFHSGLRSLKYVLIGLVRLPLGRSVRLSYGYTGEDRLIESLLKPLVTHNGYYVEVGCNEPRFISNTFLLYRRGWRGICIDANEQLVQKYRRIRPRDQAVCAFVSHRTEALSYLEFANSVLSTADPQYVPQYLARGEQLRSRRQVQPHSLTAILAERNAPARFDLLAIDAEEFDLSVLQSLDFGRYRPRLVLVEAEDFDPSQPLLHPICTFLLPLGYVLKGSMLKNLYFMDVASHTPL
ncbi:FkbM family methyltransferase [Hymenobacter psychrotolerans]|uniref:Methyltransferase, FkbM family n=1 Tax=Hymenobacter psychrotolerans DSM 18569 TaxID=1121959 RepID=A0A1M6WTM2_9BACT|nr:FkbM family methyltransferase [Hymenobacter psychrotolerans]SHK97016.1 methyltransferase, FkbM family [Hymenobacter psychrotolerans DSM 18569]